MFSRVKGTNDFLNLSLYNFALQEIKAYLALYHFAEIETPLLESVELFKRTLGQHTDVVSKEMFIIKSRDEEKEESICLRPEITASIARAFVENGIQTVPWKVFTVGQCFRYERPQKGRFREFHQVSIEVIGSDSVAQDVQVLKMLDRLFHEKLRLSNYALLINYLGCPADRVAYREKLKQFLNAHAGSLCNTCLERKEKNSMRVFDCKNPECQKLYAKAPVITDALCASCAQEWRCLQQDLELLSVTFRVNPHLVRGLDYYNKTVFEFVSGSLGAQNAFCGGGRYDSLIGELGGKPDQPSIGAAIGVERLLLALEAIQETLPLPQLPKLHVVLPLTPAQQTLALLLADELQAAGLCTELLLEGGSVKSMMRKANKMGAAVVLLLGEDEQQQNEVTMKNMLTGAEERIAQAQLVSSLKK